MSGSSIEPRPPAEVVPPSPPGDDVADDAQPRQDRSPDDAQPSDDADKASFVKRSIDSAKLRAEQVRDDLERRRTDVKVIDLAFQGVERDLRTGGGILAGAVAFRFFLFIVPYVFVMVFAFGIGADAANKDAVDLAKQSGILGIAASAVDATAKASTWAQIVTLSLALWALISGARTLVKALRAVHALVWQVPLVKVKRLTIHALAAIGIITAITVVVRLVSLLQRTSILLWLVATCLLVGVPALLWLFCSVKIFPSAPGTTWRDLWPGALFLGIGVEILHIVTVVWIARSLESKSETYGAMGAAITILFWAYLLGRLVTGAATVNAVVWFDKGGHPQTVPDDPPG